MKFKLHLPPDKFNLPLAPMLDIALLLMMFFGLLALGLSAFSAVVFGLVLYNGAVVAEILRAGDQGHLDRLALALGNGHFGVNLVFHHSLHYFGFVEDTEEIKSENKAVLVAFNSISNETIPILESWKVEHLNLPTC